jgi:hypothetical protein
VGLYFTTKNIQKTLYSPYPIYKIKKMKTNTSFFKKVMLVFVAYFICLLAASAQVQLGQDIEGKMPYDNAGTAVSMPDPYTLAIGAPVDSSFSDNLGYVQVFTWNGDTWTQKGNDILGVNVYDGFGSTLSMGDSNNIAISAIHDNRNGTYSGMVRMYSWNGNAWIQKGDEILGMGSGENLGWAISMPDANTVAISSFGYEPPHEEAGIVKVFRWNGTSWVQKGSTLIGEDFEPLFGEAIDPYFGYAVSMPNTNTIAISAPLYRDTINFYAGKVYIYNWNGIDWISKGNPIIGPIESISGLSVSMPDSNTVAISAPWYSPNEELTDGGQVRIYSWQDNMWTQKGNEINAEEDMENIGLSLSMSDANHLALSGYLIPSDGITFVRVYAWNNDEWIKIANLYSEGNDGGTNGFSSLSMPSVKALAIGELTNSENGEYAGHARVYSFCPPTFSTDVQNAINSFTWIDGNTYTSDNNVATYILTSEAGCDSVITLNLTINEINIDSTVVQSGNTLTVNATGVDYQWLDCDNNFEPIAGETNSTFTSSVDGNYAVQLSGNNYLDTSACFNLRIVGIVENSFTDKFNIFPNPTSGNLIVAFDAMQEELNLSLYALDGKLIKNIISKSTITISFEIEAPAGNYLLKMQNNLHEAVVRIVKE